MPSLSLPATSARWQRVSEQRPHRLRCICTPRKRRAAGAAAAAAAPSRSRNKQLLQDISTCNSAQDLQRLHRRHGKAMDHVALAALLHRLARLGLSSSSSSSWADGPSTSARAAPPTAIAQLFPAICQQLQRQLPKCGVRQLSSALWSAGQAALSEPQLLPPQFLPLLMTRLRRLCRDEGQLGQASSQGLACLQQGGLLPYDGELMDAMVAAAAASKEGASLQSVCSALWACAAMRHYDSALCGSAAKRAQQLLLPQEAQHEEALPPPRALSSLLWPLAVLDHREPGVLTACCSAISAAAEGGQLVSSWAPRQLATCAWALVTLDLLEESGLQQEAASACGVLLAAAAQRPASAFGPQSLAQLQQVWLALRLMPPRSDQVQLTVLPPELLQAAADAWRRQAVRSQPSASQLQVLRVLESLGAQPQAEQLVPCEGPPDLQRRFCADIVCRWAGRWPVLLEVDGPDHWTRNAGRRPLGPTRLRHRLLAATLAAAGGGAVPGAACIQLPLHEWDALLPAAPQQAAAAAAEGPSLAAPPAAVTAQQAYLTQLLDSGCRCSPQ